MKPSVEPELTTGHSFPAATTAEIKSLRESNTSFYETVSFDPNEKDHSVFIGLEQEHPHGYILIDFDNRYRKFHIVFSKRTESFYLRAEEIFKPNVDEAPVVDESKLLHICKTKLNADQLNKLALYCKYETYAWIQRDCLAFAKRMANEIATHESGMEQIEFNKLTQNLAVLPHDESLQSAEQKSRRYPNYPKGWLVAVLSSSRIDRPKIQWFVGIIGMLSLAVVVSKYIN